MSPTPVQKESCRSLARIEPPGTFDGGDIMVIKNTVHAGLSSRTNREGIEQLGRILAPYGYEVRGISVSKCLHLKSAVTQVAASALEEFGFDVLVGG